MHRTDSEPAAPPSGRRWVKDSTCAPGRGLAAVLSRSGKRLVQGPQIPVGNHTCQDAVFTAGVGHIVTGVVLSGLCPPHRAPPLCPSILGSFLTGPHQDSSAVRNGAPGRRKSQGCLGTPTAPRVKNCSGQGLQVSLKPSASLVQTAA